MAEPTNEYGEPQVPEDPAEMIETLKTEIAYLKKREQLARIEGRAWMREMIARWLEAAAQSYNAKELGAVVREIPTEPEEI